MSVPASAPVSVGPPAPHATTRCRHPGPNEASEDAYVVGVDFAAVNIADWMNARGSTAAALYRLYGSRYWQSLGDATSTIGEQCLEGKVGDPPEDALWCQPGSREMLHVHSMFVVVVRKKQPVVVIDEPVNIRNLDEPEQHYLDLQFILKSPTEYELHELAPEGAHLIRSMSDCLRMEKAGYDPETQGFHFPQDLHGCATANAAVDSIATGSKPGDGYYDASRHAKTLIARACKKDLGVWTWKNGQFVHGASAKP